jgi:hypothetical protein
MHFMFKPFTSCLNTCKNKRAVISVSKKIHFDFQAFLTQKPFKMQVRFNILLLVSLASGGFSEGGSTESPFKI